MVLTFFFGSLSWLFFAMLIDHSTYICQSAKDAYFCRITSYFSLNNEYNKTKRTLNILFCRCFLFRLSSLSHRSRCDSMRSRLHHTSVSLCINSPFHGSFCHKRPFFIQPNSSPEPWRCQSHQRKSNNIWRYWDPWNVLCVAGNAPFQDYNGAVCFHNKQADEPGAYDRKYSLVVGPLIAIFSIHLENVTATFKDYKCPANKLIKYLPYCIGIGFFPYSFCWGIDFPFYEIKKIWRLWVKNVVCWRMKERIFRVKHDIRRVEIFRGSSHGHLTVKNQQVMRPSSKRVGYRVLEGHSTVYQVCSFSRILLQTFES